MIYSQEKLNELTFYNKKIRKNTYLITMAFLFTSIILGVLVFVVKALVFAILGFICTLIAFSYFFYRLDFVHKKLRFNENFYADIVYSEKSCLEVEYVCLQGEIISNKRNFNLIKVYNFKTEQLEKYLVDISHNLTMEQNKRYILTLSNNILVDYKEVENGL